MDKLPEKDWLEELLAQPEPEIEDCDFTVWVLKAVPQRRSSSRIRLLIMLIFTFVACVLSFWVLPTGDYLWAVVDEAFCFESWIGVPITSLLVVLMIVFGAFAFANSEA
jgi:hypothetical protein